MDKENNVENTIQYNNNNYKNSNNIYNKNNINTTLKIIKTGTFTINENKKNINKIKKPINFRINKNILINEYENNKANTINYEIIKEDNSYISYKDYMT